jgi:hypothetical protein
MSSAPPSQRATHRGKRIPPRGEREAWELHLPALLASNPRAGHRYATAPQGDFALGRPGASGLPTRISLPSRTAEILAILFHHRGQNLLARVDAEVEKRPLDVRECSQQRERNLYARRLRQINDLEVVGLLGMLGHGGGSFVV